MSRYTEAISKRQACSLLRALVFQRDVIPETTHTPAHTSRTRPGGGGGKEDEKERGRKKDAEERRGGERKRDREMEEDRGDYYKHFQRL